MIDLSDLVPLINEGMETDILFGNREARAAVSRMHEGNEVMFSEETVFKI